VRFRSVIREAGGVQVWIKRPAPHATKGGGALPVLATPEGYRAVLSAVREEASRNKLDFRAESSDGKTPEAILQVTQHGQRVVRIHLREVPRLLRAAIVIDDMGRDLEAARKLLEIDAPLTFSVLPHLRYSQETAEEAHRAGREVMLHLPMEPEPNGHASAGEGALRVGMDRADVERIVADALDAVPYAAGVNNHMGSRATQNAALMAEVMQTLAGRRLYFIDSRTTAASTALDAARRQHLPAFYRAVFLDDTQTVDYTLGQLRQFQRKIEQDGVALAIGHPHPTTLTALEQFLPELDRADIELVAPSQVVRLPEAAHLQPPHARNAQPVAPGE
jgi:hypothetical protein